jgi:hypothetical protein
MTYSLNPIGDTSQFFEIIDDVDSKLPIIGTGSPQGVVAAALAGQMYMNSFSQETWVCVSTDNTINGTVWEKQTGELPNASQDQSGVVMQATNQEVASGADVVKFASPLQIQNTFLKRTNNLEDVSDKQAARTALNIQSMGQQPHTNVNIQGGVINGTSIGMSPPIYDSGTGVLTSGASVASFKEISIVDRKENDTKSISFNEITIDLGGSPITAKCWDLKLSPLSALGVYRYVNGSPFDIAAEFNPTTGSLSTYDSLVSYDKSGQVPITTIVSSNSLPSLRFLFNPSVPIGLPNFKTWEVTNGLDSTALVYSQIEDLSTIPEGNPQARGNLSLQRNGDRTTSQFAAGNISGLRMYNGQDVSTIAPIKSHSLFVGANGQDNSGILTDTKTTSLLNNPNAANSGTAITENVGSDQSYGNISSATSVQVNFTPSAEVSQYVIDLEGTEFYSGAWSLRIYGSGSGAFWQTNSALSAMAQGNVPFTSVSFGIVGEQLFVRLNGVQGNLTTFLLKRISCSCLDRFESLKCSDAELLLGNSSGSVVSTVPVSASVDSYVFLTTDAQIFSGARYVIMSESPLNLTLPNSPVRGDTFSIMNAVGSKAGGITGGGANCTLQGNGQPIMGFNEDMLLDMVFFGVKFVYINSIYGWRVNYE